MVNIFWYLFLVFYNFCNNLFLIYTLKSMKILRVLKITFVCFCLFHSMQVMAIEEPTVREGDVLTLDECVAVAINNSPVIKGKAYNLQVAISNVGIAKSAYFPILGLDSGIYQDYNSNKNYNGSSNRELPQVNVYLSQLLWNFGKSNSLIRMERFYKLAAEYEFLDSICNTIFDVKTKYYGLLNSASLVEIAQNNVILNEKNLERAEKLAKKDSKYKPDFTNAKMNLSEAKIALIDAQNNYNQALADLGNSMYIAPAPDFQIKNTETYNFYDSYMPQNFKNNSANKKDKNIVEVALKSRIEKGNKFKKLPYTMAESFAVAEKNSPDLWVLDATLSAMKQSLQYVKRQYFPDLTGNVGYGFNNTREYSNSSLSMYLNLSTAVNIKQLKHEVDRAQAEVDLASNDIDKFRQDLYFMVKKAYLNVLRAEKQVDSSKLKLEQAFENYEIVNSAYDAGETDYIAYQRAREDLNSTKKQYAQMIYEYNISLANLEIAMHTHVDNLHEKAEHAMQYHYKDLLHKLDASLQCHDHSHEKSEEPEE